MIERKYRCRHHRPWWRRICTRRGLTWTGCGVSLLGAAILLAQLLGWL